MNQHDSDAIKLPETWQAKSYLLFAVGLLLIGVSGLVIMVAPDVDSNAQRLKYLMHSYLANFVYVISFGIGAMFFVLITHLTRAGWCSSIRRLAEIISATLPWVALLFIPILVMVLAGNATPLYSWNAPLDKLDSLVGSKTGYLNGPFFAVRAVIALVGWSLIVLYYFRLSREQDESGDVGLSIKREFYAGPLIMFFALSVSMVAFDWVMSIQPEWFSTIFGVYLFAASMFGFFALMIVSFMALQQTGLTKKEVTVEHFHDMGKFLFGFTMFWSYIAFSQFLLIWYANIPEETSWYKDFRLVDGWTVYTYLMIPLHFAIPFLGLMSRHVRRHRLGLTFWAVWALVVHWMDMTFIVMPNAGAFSWMIMFGHLIGGIGMFSIFQGMFLLRASGVPLVAKRDPRMTESLTYTNPIL